MMIDEIKSKLTHTCPYGRLVYRNNVHDFVPRSAYGDRDWCSICAMSEEHHQCTCEVGGLQEYLEDLKERLYNPPKELLESMAMRLRHDYGLPKDEFGQGMTDRERELLLTDMRRVIEEINGTGFYRKRNEK